MLMYAAIESVDESIGGHFFLSGSVYPFTLPCVAESDMRSGSGGDAIGARYEQSRVG